MIKYFCNKCGERIPKTNMLIVTTQKPDGTKQSMHYCKAHSRAVMHFLLSEEQEEATPEPAAEDKDDVETVRELEANMVVSNEIEPGDSHAYVRPLAAAATKAPPKMSKCVTSNGVRIEDLIKEDSVVAISPIDMDAAYRWLVPHKPAKLPARQNIQDLFSMLISFYRGQRLSTIRNKTKLSTQALYQALGRYASMSAYERWFGRQPEFKNQKGFKINVSTVLSLVERGMPIKDLFQDTDLESASDLFKILEYYLDLELSDMVRTRYISDCGGC